MQKKSRILIFSFFGVFIVIFFAFCAVVWYVDPFRLFHQPFMCKNQVYDDMRYNARWFIKSGDYDSIILGTSMLANTSAKEAAELLGGKFINISIWGSSLEQRAILMNYALKKKPIKKIIISLDRGGLVPVNMKLDNKVSANRFDFLYTDNSNIFKVYMNIKFISKIFSFKCEEDANMDMPSSWMLKWGDRTKQRFGGLENWIKTYKDKDMQTTMQMLSAAAIMALNGYQPQNLLNTYYLEKYQKDLDNNVLKFAKDYPNTEFVLVIPPYFMAYNSILRFSADGYSALQKELIRYVLNQKLSNIKLYAYDYLDFTYDVGNYMDLGHYSPEINSKILQMLSKKEGELNLSNLDKWWQKYDEAAMNYNFLNFYHDFATGVEAQKAIDAKEM